LITSVTGDEAPRIEERIGLQPELSKNL